jgi:hypothetical protein
LQMKSPDDLRQRFARVANHAAARHAPRNGEGSPSLALTRGD